MSIYYAFLDTSMGGKTGTNEIIKNNWKTEILCAYVTNKTVPNNSCARMVSLICLQHIIIYLRFITEKQCLYS